MIRFVFRFIGLWILAAGFVALVRDGTKSIAGNAVFITRLVEDWNNLHDASLTQLKTLVERYAGAPVWELTSRPAINPCVVCPAATHAEKTRTTASRKTAFQFSIGKNLV